MHYTIRELTSLEEMLPHLHLMQQMYPHLNEGNYSALLAEMLPMGYKQILVLDGERSVGMAAYWLITRLWCGKTLDVDNVVVHPDYRNRKAGQAILDYMNAKAEAEGCTRMVLDAYVSNHKAHRFYFRDGYEITGFHFTKKVETELPPTVCG